MIGPSNFSVFMVSLALSVNLRAAECCRAQNQGLLFVAKAFRLLMSIDALRNPISVEKLQGPIVIITAVSSGASVSPVGK
jgi:hypothetical protein